MSETDDAVQRVDWHSQLGILLDTDSDGLSIHTNLFGTTFYSLVGLHASHVIVGLFALLVVMAFAMGGFVKQEHAERAHVLALYWHFVDTVWIVVFTVVYIIGR